jgi:hypothetical protein
VVWWRMIKFVDQKKKIKFQRLQDPSHTNVDNRCNTMGQRIHRSNFRINNNIYYTIYSIKSIQSYFKLNKKEPSWNLLINPQENRTNHRPYLPIERFSPLEEPTAERLPLRQPNFKTKARRNLDPIHRLANRPQPGLFTPTQTTHRQKGSSFKGY